MHATNKAARVADTVYLSLVLSLIALLFPPYYETTFRIAQPIMFTEVAIMLWLLIKGAKVPIPPHALQSAAAHLVPS